MKSIDTLPYKVLWILSMLLFCTEVGLYAQKIRYRMLDQETQQEVKATNDDELIKTQKPFDRWSGYFMNGVGWESENKKWWVGSAGLWTTAWVYNYVDGMWLGQIFNINYQIDDDRLLKIEPSVYYTTARKRMVWEIKSDLTYASHMKGKVAFGFGSISADYDSDEHLARLENTLYNLFLGRNIMRLYQKDYVELRNNLYPLPGFRLFSGISFQRRSPLENHTQRNLLHFFDPEENVPDNDLFKPMPVNYALLGNIGFEFTPGQEERKTRNSNEIIYSRFPTLSANFLFGAPVGKLNHSSYKRIDLSIGQRFKFTPLSTLDYKVSGGSFIAQNNLWFPDLKHFGAYSLPSMRTFAEDGLFLIGYYRADTDKRWLTGAANYMSEDFLLTRLPKLNRHQFNEGLHTRFLWTDMVRNYHEYGYSIGYKELLRTGIFIGFEQMKFYNIGVTLSFPWLVSGY